jgi:DNA-binding NarL/FixJ family response regulator
VKILVVDDHKMMRDGLTSLLEHEGLTVVGECGDGHEAVDLARRLRPDVVVMDLAMPGLNGVDATRQLVADLPGVKVLALSAHSDRRDVVAMFQAGAVGYVLKSSAAKELLEAVRAIGTGLTYVSPAVAAIVVSNCVTPGSPTQPGKRLSPRERQVLQLLAEGNSSKDIARTLNLAVTTVETHRRQIMDKLNVRTVAELTKYAIREGLTSLE